MTLHDVIEAREPWHIETTDVLDGLASIPNNSVSTIVTSPPYWAVRSYNTSPVIWDADPECEHDFTSEESKHRPGQHSPNGLPTPHGESHVDEMIGQRFSGNATCSKCGAWRGELGSEPTVSMFVRHLTQIFHECYRVLHPSGTLWLNIGDTYFGGGRGPTGSTGIGTQQKRQGFEGSSNRPDGKRDQRGLVGNDGLKDRDLCLIPERLAIALQEDGWYIRSRIAWCKASSMPESIKNRPTAGWEHVWMCTKRPDYFFDMEAVKEKRAVVSTHQASIVRPKSTRGVQTGAVTNASRTINGERTIYGVQPRNYWVLATEPFSGSYCKNCQTIFEGLDKQRIVTKKHKQRLANGNPAPSGWQQGPGAHDTSAVDGNAPKGNYSEPDPGEVRVCPVCKSTDGWVDHYASFPTEVVKRTMLATTSEHGVCSAPTADGGICGAPWRRILSESPEALASKQKQKARRNGELQDHGDIASVYVTGGNALTGSATIGTQQEGRNKFGKSAPTADLPPAPTTIGWEPTCTCRQPSKSSPDAPESTDTNDPTTGVIPSTTPYPPIPALVLDPFSGSGTTCLVSVRAGRRAIGLELMPDYAELSRQRIGQDSPLMQSLLEAQMQEAMNRKTRIVTANITNMDDETPQVLTYEIAETDVEQIVRVSEEAYRADMEASETDPETDSEPVEVE